MNSFLQGRKTLTVPPLRTVAPSVLPTASASSTATPRPKAASECSGTTPTVEVVKEGDKVVRLVVVCTCGERVEIECLYPAAG